MQHPDNRKRFIRLVKETIADICSGGLMGPCATVQRVDGLLGITLSTNEVFLINIGEQLRSTTASTLTTDASNGPVEEGMVQRGRSLSPQRNYKHSATGCKSSGSQKRANANKSNPERPTMGKRKKPKLSLNFSQENEPGRLGWSSSEDSSTIKNRIDRIIVESKLTDVTALPAVGNTSSDFSEIAMEAGEGSSCGVQPLSMNSAQQLIAECNMLQPAVKEEFLPDFAECQSSHHQVPNIEVWYYVHYSLCNAYLGYL